MINLLRRLMTAHGVPGREDKIREAIIKEVEPYVDEISVDALGNLIAHKKGNGKKVMLGAHMDEIGYFVTGIRSNGKLSVTTVGGIDLISGAFTEVVSENGLKGMLVTTNREAPSGENVVIDIGASDKKQAEKRVKVGDYFVHTPKLTHLLGTRYAGRPIDDRVGCAVLVEALKRVKNTDNDLYFVFTTQEEVGGRGVRPVTYSIAPEVAIAVDVTKVDNGTDALDVALGKGATVKIKDSSVICTHEIVEKMRELATEAGISYQEEILVNGGTDTAGMQIARAGCKVGAISVPCENIHTGAEMIDSKDYKSAIELATLVAERI